MASLKTVFGMGLMAVSMAALGQSAGQWVGGNGQSCKAVCENSKLNAVSVGAVAGYNEAFVCAGSTGGDTGKRSGFLPEGVTRCHVFSGDHKEGGERLSSYSCLCTSSPTSQP
ncbi:hypothetical protein AWB79_07534 [Caballeronia hypogeia]|uniref:Lipoprotein n=1 Tax=Caballeronia hypogeia TaxID=1777140 RepID=A0A158DTK0_9BURK|nr:hypothetical protein AWB79_07534 [Caballeronia hypogeia]